MRLGCIMFRSGRHRPLFAGESTAREALRGGRRSVEPPSCSVLDVILMLLGAGGGAFLTIALWASTAAHRGPFSPRH